MARTRVLLIACFAVALAAGVAIGLVVGRSGRDRHGHSWLMAELNLTPQQREQMQQIWSETMESSGRKHWEQRRAIAAQRDSAIVGLLTAEQKAKYERIGQDYDRKMAELSQQRKAAFDQAIERTKKILTPTQAAKYDELLRKQRERRGGGPGRRGMGPPGPPGPWPEGPHTRQSGPDSRPTTDEHRPARGGQ